MPYTSSATHDSKRPLPRVFYDRDTASVARDMLGTILVRNVRGCTISGIISETEAYGAADDPASHAYKKMTQRNHIMFGKKVGMSYVYFTYGMHYCFNATARNTKKSIAGAVLVRSVIPQKGIKTMIKNRGTSNAKILTDGPAKISQAFEISQAQYGEDLTSRVRLYITGNPEYDAVRKKGIIPSTRIGIKKSTEVMWNFSLVKI